MPPEQDDSFSFQTISYHLPLLQIESFPQPALEYPEEVPEKNCDLSQTEDYDPATIYRNLIKLTDAHITTVVSRVDGVAHYQLVNTDQTPGHEAHQHPHFVCDDCGEIACLPVDLIKSIEVEGPWSLSVKHAQIQLRGECPDCFEKQPGLDEEL